MPTNFENGVLCTPYKALKMVCCAHPTRLVLKLYNDETQFFLEHGECTASLESPHGPFFISTPNGRVEALGTEFTVTVTDE
ncbi:MAG TPA: FecR domain-containing protein [Sedimentisphaerales bacterium]|nr:FecR domain-containing protein [Sedimentisphaerales bacterium]